MSSSTMHPLLWSLCVVQFGLLSVLATKFFGSDSSSSSKTKKEESTPKMSGSIVSTEGGKVRRITMFKVPDPENQKKFVDAYERLREEQQKGGEPYILSVQASVVNDPRAKGYTIVAETEFASLDDMKYYDAECPAHMSLKKNSRGLGVTEPPLVVYY